MLPDGQSSIIDNEVWHLPGSRAKNGDDIDIPAASASDRFPGFLSFDHAGGKDSAE